MRYVAVFITIAIAFLGTVSPVLASSELTSNNKFGIHLAVASDEDLQDASSLVNSSGGDWGYVTLVIEEKDRRQEKWQQVFDQMRRLHLIPIVRLATTMENGSWRKPETREVPGWVDFLDSLNWVVKNRYIVLFNEPNRADEWGGRVDPEDYGWVALEFARALKERNSDFFIMLSGLDAAAPQQPPTYFDEERFLKMALAASDFKIFNYLDGWASHSYPNHGFVGSPWDRGRNSIKTYLWEIELLKRLGFKKDLPVFITETGWPHVEGISLARNFYSQEVVAENLRSYFRQLIDDPRVVAITPFVLNYQGEPFDHFSWRKLGDTRDFYPQYQTVQSLTKIKGEPVQEQKLEIGNELPLKLIEESTYQIPLSVKNLGQAIWSQKDGYRLKLLGSQVDFEHFFSDFFEVYPFGEQTIWLYFKTGNNLGKYDLNLVVAKDGKPVSNMFAWPLEVLPAVDLEFKVSLFPKRKTEGSDFKLLIYNDKEEVVFEKDKVAVKDGLGKVEKVKNLAIGGKYRVVILKPGYLPRQGFLIIQEKTNQITLKQMLPLDFNQDGKFSFTDLLGVFNGSKLFRLFWLY